MPTIDVEGYLSGRLEEQIAYYETAAGRAKQMHLWLQSCIIVLSVMAPLAVNQDWKGWQRPLVLLGALILPVMTGLTSFRKYGETWISYRTTAELLKNEKYLFLTGSGRYRDNPHAFQDLVEAVEALLSTEHTKFRATFTEARQAPGGAGGKHGDHETAGAAGGGAGGAGGSRAGKTPGGG